MLNILFVQEVISFIVVRNTLDHVPGRNIPFATMVIIIKWTKFALCIFVEKRNEHSPFKS